MGSSPTRTTLWHGSPMAGDAGLRNQTVSVRVRPVLLMETGLSTEVVFVRAIDGDTIELEIKRRFKVRLRDIDCPERNTDEGQEAKAEVEDLLSNAEKIIVFLPSNDPIQLMDMNSFNRLVGDLFADETNVADHLKKKGFIK